VVSANDPPRFGVTDSEEACWIQAKTNRAQRQAEEQRQAIPPCAHDLRLEFEEAGVPTFNSPQANLGALLAHLQQTNPPCEANVAMAYVQVAIALVEERSATSKSVSSTLSWHSRSRSNRPAHSKLPTIQEEVNQPQANAAPGVDLHANLDKIRCGRDAHGYIDQRHREHEVREHLCRLDYDREYSPPGAVHRIMGPKERDRHDVENRQCAQY
jgi:hypothetical protein